MDKKAIIIKMAESKGFIRPKDVETQGIAREYLYRLHRQGALLKVGRGLYSLPSIPDTEHLSLMEVAKKVPAGVISLYSALCFHELTTQLPHEVWITLPRGSHRPKFDYPVMEITYASGENFNHGIERHIIEGVQVKIYSIAKTLADCFKARRKVPLDVALESLRETLRSKKASIADIVRAAEICRVWNRMRPYLEAMV